MPQNPPNLEKDGELLKPGQRRPLTYFGHKHDGRCTLIVRQMKLITFWFRSQQPILLKHPEEDAKHKVVCGLKIRGEQNLASFLVAPERKNVWTGGIRSLCEGVLSAKQYKSPEGDKGVYTVIPDIGGPKVPVEKIYQMWLALESAMIRREPLLIVEDAALAQVTKFRTEEWRTYNRLIWCGTIVSVFFATWFRSIPSLYFVPASIGVYGYLTVRSMHLRDPASKYSECRINKQYEVDPTSSESCDAQISFRYLRSPQYRMFKLENHHPRDHLNMMMTWCNMTYCVLACWRNMYNFEYADNIFRVGPEEPLDFASHGPLNIFSLFTNRFLTFGSCIGPGRVDTIHWLVEVGIFYYFILRHIPWVIQTFLERQCREFRMESSIRYLQFRNLQGEDRYEFPARNLYRTMMQDYPRNRVLKEMYDHYNDPPEGYYESEEFLKTRKPYRVSFWNAMRRIRVYHYRTW